MEFDCKEFSLNHSKSSMKIGTDAILLASIVKDYFNSLQAVNNISSMKNNKEFAVRELLDVGCGCGILSLCMAQIFPFTHIQAIDIDAPSVKETQENFAHSKYFNRMDVKHIAFQDFAIGREELSKTQSEVLLQTRQDDSKQQDNEHGNEQSNKQSSKQSNGQGSEQSKGQSSEQNNEQNNEQEYANQQYDIIISNPPFFTSSLVCPDERRTKARHNNTLSLEDFVLSCKNVMAEQSFVCVILPKQEAQEMRDLFSKEGVFAVYIVDVFAKEGSICKRQVIIYSNFPLVEQQRQLYIRDANNIYTQQYKTLTSPFLL